MQLEINFAVELNPAPVQHLMVGDRVKRHSDPYSIYEVTEIENGIANLKSIACGTGRRIKDLNAPLFNLTVVPVEFVLEQVPPDNPVVLEQVPPDSSVVLEQVPPDNPVVLEQVPPDNPVVLEQVLEQSAPEQNPHWIESYSPTKRKGYNYYRYVWMQGRKLHHIHIRGNVNGPIARRNYLEVELAIAMGKAPKEIEQLIKSWRQRK